MAFSYSGDPSTSDKDTVRFYLQDIDPTLQLMQDEEILFLLSQWDSVMGSPLFTAAVAAEVLAGRFAREINVSADGVSVSTGELQERFNNLAASLRDQYKAQYGNNGPDLASLMFDTNYDPTIKPLNFGTGFMDNYWAGSQSYGWYDPSSDPMEWDPRWGWGSPAS